MIYFAFAAVVLHLVPEVEGGVFSPGSFSIAGTIPLQFVTQPTFTGYALLNTNGAIHPGPNPLGILNPSFLSQSTNLAGYVDTFGGFVFVQNPTRSSDGADFLTTEDLSSSSPFSGTIDGSGLINVVGSEKRNSHEAYLLAGQLSTNGWAVYNYTVKGANTRTNVSDWLDPDGVTIHRLIVPIP